MTKKNIKYMIPILLIVILIFAGLFIKDLKIKSLQRDKDQQVQKSTSNEVVSYKLKVDELEQVIVEEKEITRNYELLIDDCDKKVIQLVEQLQSISEEQEEVFDISVYRFNFSEFTSLVDDSNDVYYKGRKHISFTNNIVVDYIFDYFVDNRDEIFWNYVLFRNDKFSKNILIRFPLNSNNYNDIEVLYEGDADRRTNWQFMQTAEDRLSVKLDNKLFSIDLVTGEILDIHEFMNAKEVCISLENEKLYVAKDDVLTLYADDSLKAIYKGADIIFDEEGDLVDDDYHMPTVLMSSLTGDYYCYNLLVSDWFEGPIVIDKMGNDVFGENKSGVKQYWISNNKLLDIEGYPPEFQLKMFDFDNNTKTTLVESGFEDIFVSNDGNIIGIEVTESDKTYLKIYHSDDFNKFIQIPFDDISGRTSTSIDANNFFICSKSNGGIEVLYYSYEFNDVKEKELLVEPMKN